MKNVLVTILLLFISLNTLASEGETTRVVKDLQALKKLTPENYLKEIDSYRESFKKYIDWKKRVCKGEFSSVVLSEVRPGEGLEAKKLTLDEKKSCFREMKTLHVMFINNMFDARKRYLENTHLEQLAQLEKVKLESIKKLNNSFMLDLKKKKKKRKSKKKR